MISFHTSYLKANFPLEFLVASMMSQVRSKNKKKAKDNILRIKSEIRQMGVKIRPPDINQSGLTYQIVDNGMVMTGLGTLKWMSKDAVPEIQAKRPFTSFDDFVMRVEPKKLNANSIKALAASGALDSLGIDRKMVFYYGADYRDKLKVYHKKKPERRPEKFEYPWPAELPWDIRETYAMEDHYLGEGLAGTIWDRYEDFFDTHGIRFPLLAEQRPYHRVSDNQKEDRRGNSHPLGLSVNDEVPGIKGVVTHLFVFKVKKEDSTIFGQTMCRMNVQDPWGNDLSILAFPETWEKIQDRVQRELRDDKRKLKLEPGLAIFFNGTFQWENQHEYSFVIDDIIGCKGPPALPEDLKSKKVKMPRATRSVKKKDLEEMDKEDLLEQIENDLIEQGASPIDEDDDRFDPFDG
jgi:DNA polymerase III alpha subunit